MLDATPALVPLQASTTEDLYGPTRDGEMPLDPRLPYAAAIGAISYIANSARPEISYSVNDLARNTHTPTKRHLPGGLNILRYLNGSRDYGLYYRRVDQPNNNDDEGLKIICYADAGYLNDWSTGKSQSGVLFTIGGTAFSWR